jgi:hypothetical protein
MTRPTARAVGICNYQVCPVESIIGHGVSMYGRRRSLMWIDHLGDTV